MLATPPVLAQDAAADVLVLPPVVHRRLFTVAEYYAMLDAGILHEDDRLELIEGEIVEMSPINFAHAGLVTHLIAFLGDRLGKQAALSPQNPLDLGNSQPQPDIVVLKPPAQRYLKTHPKPEDVLWVIEVSDSTLSYDRTVKVPLYARHSIPEVWIINVTEQCIEQFSDPARKGYRHHRQWWVGDEFQAGALGVRFQVHEILGREDANP